MRDNITIVDGREINVVGDGNNQILTDPKDMGDTFIDRCETTNYVPLEDYSKFGTLKLGRAIHWKQGDFYKALQNITNDEARLCKEQRRYIPCIAQKHNSDFKEGDTVEYYIKGKNGHWAFRYDTLSKMMKLCGDEIAVFVDKLEEKRAEEAELKSNRRTLAKAKKCNICDLDRILIEEAMKGLK